MKIKKFGNIEARVYEMVLPIAQEHGLIVWDVRFEKEGAAQYLRVLLDHAERAVNLEDCEAVSRPLSEKLDEEDPIPQSYTLEVGSAGLERELLRETHFDACEGCDVRVRLIRPDENGERDISGVLRAHDRETVTIETRDGDRVLQTAQMAYIRLADFDENELATAARDSEDAESEISEGE